MIKSYILYAESGEIIATMVNDPASAEACAASSGLQLMESDVATPDTHYVKRGTLRHRPPKPGAHHRFNTTTESWEPDFESAWSDVRLNRDAKLSASDWTQLPDVPLTTKEVWANYRQALRDVTLQPDPFNIVWPVAP